MIAFFLLGLILGAIVTYYIIYRKQASVNPDSERIEIDENKVCVDDGDIPDEKIDAYRSGIYDLLKSSSLQDISFKNRHFK